jgi:hypothetical protein
VMPSDEIDGRGIGGLAAFTAQTAKQIFESHIALALDQEPHGRVNATASTARAMQLDHALRPVRQPMRFGAGASPIVRQEHKKNKQGRSDPAGVPERLNLLSDAE